MRPIRIMKFAPERIDQILHVGPCMFSGGFIVQSQHMQYALRLFS
ncbi:hypothetical protein SCE1572_31970 [Sorangium cellulosum So0157-2]|uniref:Uncharacterized protein n=1 Tax=Sorangium cellulosum So0157-2 TaxID=1254432 RepID=S4XZP3_SORCE|nr:hypothetical protein SCE1572_31970 [Sorangium cellulosum So0157-2]